MRLLRSFSPAEIVSRVTAGLLAMLCASLIFGSSALQAQEFAASPRIVDRIDESQLVTLKGNTHPAANSKNDLGRVDATLPMSDLILVLSRSAEQQAAFDQFVASQYDPTSPNFHQWLEPADVGAKFGPSESDIATVTNWLTGHGFTVSEVTKDHMSIRFSGTAGQVESAFHTEIHNLSVKGVAHIANMSDPQIPAALAPAVVGVKALHNFFPKPAHHLGSTATRDSKSGKWMRSVPAATASSTSSVATPLAAIRPQFGISVPAQNGYSAYQVEDVSPYDFATIYNILPLWNASTPIDGTGQTIAIAATSGINLSDIVTFRSTFGLSSNAPTNITGNSQTVHICTDTTGNVPYPSNPCTTDDLIENTLDAEWSGAVAKGASIIVVSSYPSSASDDNLFDSENFIVQNKTAKIMNVSYGECELGEGTSGNTEYNNLWQTAASEGIAVFVAAGDSGAASCDDGYGGNGQPYAAEYGLSVSGLASTPYNTAVGGTDFNWCSLTQSTECTPAPYWSSTSNSTTKASALGYVPEVPWNDTCASPLAVAYLNVNWAQPLSVSGVTNPEAACNFVVDLYESYNRNYAYYGSELSPFVDAVGGSGGASSCTVSNGSTVASCSGGYAKPSWQTGVPGIPADGKRDIPDVSFFASAGFLSSSSYLICVSEVAACTYTTSSEPTAQEVGGTSVASPAMAGVMALINQKAGGSQAGGSPGVNAELYALAAKQTYSNCSAEKGTTTNGCYFNDIDAGPNAAAYNNATPCLSGSPNCTVLYSGDQVGILNGYSAGTGYDLATGLGSLNVANVVNNWPAALGTKLTTVTVSPSATNITSSQSLTVTVTVASSPTGGTTPTGTVTLSGGGYTSATATLASGTATITIPSGSLSSGTDTLSVSYSGDTTYAAASGTSTVTVTKLTPLVTATPSVTVLNSNQQMTVSVAVAGSGVTPTGTVTLTGGGYTAPTATLVSGNYTFTIPYNVLTGGTYSLAVLYSGDGIYNATSGSTAPITVTFVQVLTPTVTVTPAASTVGTAVPLTVTGTVTGSGVTPTGTVKLSGGGYTSSSVALLAGAYSFTIPAGSLNVGSDPLTVAYSGDPNYYPAPGSATVTVTQSTYTLAATTPAAIAPGASATSTITVTAVSGFASTVTLTCTLTSPTVGVDLPSCSIPSTAVAMGGTATATVTTTAASAALVYPNVHGKGDGWLGAGGGAVLAFLVCLWIPARRRNWLTMVGVLLVMVALGSVTGCGGGSSTTSTGNAGTTAGTYTFTITGVGSDKAATTTTTSFAVTVN